MTLDPSVFKAYDVRGIHPTEIDEEGAYAVGRAFVEEFEPRTIAVGRDMRTHAASMAAALIEGATEAGSDVLDIGMVGTEMLYFAVGSLGLDGGITVTASHNPKQYSGMKIVRRGARPVGGDTGLSAMRERAERGFAASNATGAVEERDIYADWADQVLSFIEPSRLRPLRVVLDAANGMGGRMMSALLERLAINAIECYFEPDGTFPNHEPNPLLPENRAFIVEKVKAEGADLGIAFDGDADRCFFVDDTGEFVPGDFITALLAGAVLDKEPAATIIYDVRASWAVPDTVAAAGGTALVNRVGHAFIKQRMREVEAAFAGEVSGHYYFRDFYQADSGTIPALLMLQILSERAMPLSEMLAPLRERYFLTGELNTRVPDVALKLQEVKEQFGRAGEISHLDGISITAEDWHMNVRPSNTEPLLRLNLEARSQTLMESKRDEVLALLEA